MRVKSKSVTVRMRPLFGEGVTVWEFDGELVGGIVGGIVWGIKEVTRLARDICDLYRPLKDPEAKVRHEGEDWTVELYETEEVRDD